MWFWGELQGWKREFLPQVNARLHALLLLKLILALGFIPSAAAAFFQGVDSKNVFKKGRGGGKKAKASVEAKLLFSGV